MLLTSISRCLLRASLVAGLVVDEYDMARAQGLTLTSHPLVYTDGPLQRILHSGFN